jgi:2-methylcitrate dehydratase PrpD
LDNIIFFFRSEIEMNYATVLAERYSNLRYEELTSNASQKTKECIIDYLSATYAGLSYESSRIVREFAFGNYALGECTVIGSKEKLVPAGACFINSTTGHTAELDDGVAGVGHSGAIVIPTALAMGESLGLAGKDVLMGIIIGYDMFTRVGKSSNLPALYDRGFHPTPLFGMFAAVMTAARLMDLSVEKTANALGIVGSFLAGNLECYSDGSLTKRLHAGIASSSGITAAILASNGYTGPKTILEGPRGFFHAYCENPKPEELNEIGSLNIEKVNFKPHSCCRFNQAAIDAVLEIRSIQKISHKSIKSVVVELPRTPYDIVGQPAEIKFDPKNVVDAQFSAPYSVAIACIEGRAFLEEYTESSIQRPDVKDLMKKIVVKHADDLDKFFPETFPARVTVTMDNGRSFTKEVGYLKGDWRNPLSWEEILQKFTLSVSSSIESKTKRQQIIETIDAFEKIKDIKDFTQLLS